MKQLLRLVIPLILTVPASARQLNYVSQTRAIEGSATAENSDLSAAVDMDGRSAPDFARFDEFVSVSATADVTSSSATAVQDSQLEPLFVEAVGSASASTNGPFDGPAFAFGNARTELDVTFELGTAHAFDLVGDLSHGDSGSGFVRLSTTSGTSVFSFSASAPANEIFSQSGVLAAGTYRLEAISSTSSFSGSFGSSFAGFDFRIDFTPTTGTTYCSPAIANSTGLPALLKVTGSDVVADNDLTLRACNLPQNQFGYFLASQLQGFVPLAGGSQGNLCLGQPLGRFAALIQSSGSTGEISIEVDLTNIPLLGPVAQGDTFNFQCWYRDVGSNSNFSDAVEVVFR